MESQGIPGGGRRASSDGPQNVLCFGPRLLFRDLVGVGTVDRPAWLAGPLILVHGGQRPTSLGVEGDERRGGETVLETKDEKACRILNPRLGDVRREKHGAWSTEHEAIDHRSFIIGYEVLSIVSESPSGRQRC